ncbi:hypothetical protein HN832_00335 [archaeon]|jgi:hypothetical protein|nr:hypothetical protein [archaeon]MBT4373691.1 hypothetical protein [archaeon]MBT4531745.1 hypothetical protein [archaeon]MBT7001857.1 hypothetical protein [archaeon]MBT7281842.1 hypothetical protein [archaeon]
MKDFDDFLKRGVVKKQSVNEPRAKDLVSEAERKLSSMNRVIKKIGIDDANANDIIENCCDIILSLIRSKMFLKGFSASGSGAHEAEVSFLKKLEFNEQQIEFINSLRYFRNGILYYGKRFDKEYAKKVVKFLKQVKVKLK